MNKKPIIIAILFIASAIFYYNFTNPIKTQTLQVSRIIDGDTIETSNGIFIRLIGINTPEKSMPFYAEAKNYLTQLIQNKTVQVQTYGTDKYGRTLAFIFIDDKNINEQLLKQGLATLYCYKGDPCTKKLEQAEEFARLNQKALWQQSPDADCIEITEFKTNEPEKLTLQNNCDKQINLTFKDDANHIYKTILNPKSTFTKTFSHIWNDDGDSIYIRNNDGLLIFQRY